MRYALTALAAMAFCRPAAADAPVVTEAVTLADLNAVQTGEGAELVRGSFPKDGCAAATFAVRGSFTAPGAAQVMVSASVGCGGPGTKTYVLVYQGGRELWRTQGPMAVRALDVDGDGLSEWVAVSRDCKYTCRADAWATRKSGRAAEEVLSVQPAEESLCDEEERAVLWTTVRTVFSGGSLREDRTPHRRPCR